jgi:AraC-like DNA-binding protein
MSGDPTRRITSVLALDDGAESTTYPVDERLKEHVSAYWSLVVHEPPVRIRIVPDACVDIVLDLDTGESHLCGVIETPFEAIHERATRLVGATLWPGAASSLLDVSVSELRRSWQPLAEVIGPVARAIVQRVRAASSLAEQIAVLETFLMARLGRSEPRVERALRAVWEANGDISVDAMGRVSGASTRNLSRLFHEAVGMAPKRFTRIVRAQAALRRLAEAPPPDLNELAAELGYADQAHMTREVRWASGVTPKALADSFKGKSEKFKT